MKFFVNKTLKFIKSQSRIKTVRFGALLVVLLVGVGLSVFSSRTEQIFKQQAAGTSTACVSSCTNGGEVTVGSGTTAVKYKTTTAGSCTGGTLCTFEKETVGENPVPTKCGGDGQSACTGTGVSSCKDSTLGVNGQGHCVKCGVGTNPACPIPTTCVPPSNYKNCSVATDVILNGGNLSVQCAASYPKNASTYYCGDSNTYLCCDPQSPGGGDNTTSPTCGTDGVSQCVNLQYDNCGVTDPNYASTSCGVGSVCCYTANISHKFEQPIVTPVGGVTIYPTWTPIPTPTTPVAKTCKDSSGNSGNCSYNCGHAFSGVNDCVGGEQCCIDYQTTCTGSNGHSGTCTYNCNGINGGGSTCMGGQLCCTN